VFHFHEIQWELFLNQDVFSPPLVHVLIIRFNVLIKDKQATVSLLLIDWLLVYLTFLKGSKLTLQISHEDKHPETYQKQWEQAGERMTSEMNGWPIIESDCHRRLDRCLNKCHRCDSDLQNH
jgi:hypothetical protein